MMLFSFESIRSPLLENATKILYSFSFHGKKPTFAPVSGFIVVCARPSLCIMKKIMAVNITSTLLIAVAYLICAAYINRIPYKTRRAENNRENSSLHKQTISQQELTHK